MIGCLRRWEEAYFILNSTTSANGDNRKKNIVEEEKITGILYMKLRMDE